jgi:plasmid maintenance system antidote protein VapI
VELIAAYHQRKSIKELAQRHEVHRTTVAALLGRHSAVTERPVIRLLLAREPTHWSYREMAEALERTVAAMAAPWAAEGWPVQVDETGRAVTAECSAASAGSAPWRVSPRC